MPASDHKPVLVGQPDGRTRVDCTCGATGLGTVKSTSGMAPVVSLITTHRQAQP